ncbi:MAG: gliding motility-associated C-terminal domain-containing protein, partial [Bacteroidota bacterium]
IFDFTWRGNFKDTTEIFRHYFYDFDNIQLYELPQELYDTLYICQEEGGIFDPEKQIDLPRPLPKTFQWLDQAEAGLREFQKSGTFQMDIELLCGVIDFELVVIEKVCTPKVFAPNVFSPNFDGINDDFQLFIESDLPLENYELQVYDRWGNRVFAASDPTQSWDGRYRGQVVPAGVYSWYAKWDLFTPTGNVEEYLESGSLTVLP